MGYYIQTPITIGKANYLKKHFKAVEIPCPKTLSEVPAGMGLICVVENPMFDAAGYMYDDRELARALQTEKDQRKRTWLIFDKQLIEKLSGFIKERKEA